MARASMADLISLVRTQFLNDVGSVLFTDDQIQAALDTHRLDVFQLRLDVADDVQPNQYIYWKDFYAELNWFEADAQLQDHNFQYVTADVAEPLIGHWHFNASQIIPLYVTGKHYDVYGAAVDLLMWWKSKLKLEVDFMDSGRTYQRMQRMRAIDGLIKDYRSRMKPRALRQIKVSDAPQSRRRHRRGW
jgi:hypothetical protein